MELLMFDSIFKGFLLHGPFFGLVKQLCLFSWEFRPNYRACMIFDTFFNCLGFFALVLNSCFESQWTFVLFISSALEKVNKNKLLNFMNSLILLIYSLLIFGRWLNSGSMRIEQLLSSASVGLLLSGLCLYFYSGV